MKTPSLRAKRASHILGRILTPALLSLSSLPAYAAADTITYSFSYSAGMVATPSDSTWSFSAVAPGGNDVLLSLANCLQIGSKTKTFTSATLTHTTTRSVSKVAATLSGFNNTVGNVSLVVTVGGTQLGEKHTISSTSDYEATFIASASDPLPSGQVALTFTVETTVANRSQGVKLKTVTITSEESSDESAALDAPTFSPEAGTYFNPISVNLSAAEGAAIYYTTDGTRPTAETEKRYSEAFTLTEGTTTVRAFAILAGDTSAVAEATYTIATSYGYVLASGEDVAAGGDFLMASEADLSSALVATAYNSSSNSLSTTTNADDYSLLTFTPSGDYCSITLADGTTLGYSGSGTNLSDEQNTRWHITEGDEEGQFVITNAAVSSSRHLLFSMGWSYVKLYDTAVVGNYSDEVFLFKRVEMYFGTLSLSTAGYATFYWDTAFVVPEGVTGGTVGWSEREENVLAYDWNYPAGSVVPALTPIVVKGEAGSYTFEETDEEGAAFEGNLLVGTLEQGIPVLPDGEDAADYCFYKLAYRSSQDSTLGFWWGEEDGGAFAIGANKACLAVPREAAVRVGYGMSSAGENLVGIASRRVSSEAASPVEVYLLSGVRAGVFASEADALQTLPSGLYLIDGRLRLIPYGRR